jgi:hypothetical protein
MHASYVTLSIGHQSVRLMPRRLLAPGPSGKALAILIQRILGPGELTDERSEFAEILVLAENQSHVELPLMRCVERIKGKPHVNSLFLAGKKRVRAKARNLDRPVAVDKLPAIDDNATPAHHRELVRPEVVPKCVVCG